MTPTLSRLSSLIHLAPLRRIPFWAQALALCALFAIAGVAVVDDYGVTVDESTQHRIAIANANYIATGSPTDTDDAHGLYHRDYRYYGVAFEMPLLLAERALRLQDARPIYLTRHLLTHLFFIAGGFACGMLAYRMFGSRWIALLATLLFLLHPRLYAHSFFNTKDIPFAVMVVIALYLTHRAFRKDTLGAFLLCGVGVGLAINLRPFGLMLLPLILAMRAPDLWQASGRADRKRILASAVAFAAAALATLYITHPHYWENPLRFIEGVRFLSQHPTLAENLFMGKIYLSYSVPWSDKPDVPWNYIPGWFAITAPPITLTLGALGAAAVCWQAITRPLAALLDRETRFRVLLLGCIVLPVAVVIALQANIYDGWRQMYFLWTPFCLLAAVGLHRLASVSAGSGKWNIAARLPGWVRGGARLHMARRTLAYGIAGVGLITTLTAMAALHPHQQVYFNPLVDTKTPGALAERYDMDYWQVAHRQSLEYLLARYPDDSPRVWMLNSNRLILSKNDRERISIMSPHVADFYLWLPRWRYPLLPANPQEAGAYLHPLIEPWNMRDKPLIHSVRAYDNPIALIYGKNTAAYRAAYEDVAANGDLLARSDFDIYAYDGALYYLSAGCAPPAPSRPDLQIFLHFFPANPADLPVAARDRGFESRDFWLNAHAVFFDGKCMNRQPLPSYPIERIATGVYLEGKTVWRANINLAARAAASAVHDGILAGDYGAPIAESRFDLYLRDNALTYLKAPCAEGDANARFLLHIFPADPADLLVDRREFGFANLDFQFAYHGAYVDGICVATRDLPDYPIARVRTGQNAAASGGDGWRADINLAARVAARAVHDRIAAGDYGPPIAQSHFNLYLRDNALTYLKAPCAESDADARFFLHIFPTDPAILPTDRREFGFVNSGFSLEKSAAFFDGKCVHTQPLPDYPIARFRTGQLAAASGGDVWRADINLAAQALYESIAAGDYGKPVAQSRFDLYLSGNVLTYLKESCAPGDTHARFFLHITPADVSALPAAARERGFANLDFQFADHGAYAGDICVASLALPDYPIARIRTGQFVSGEGSLWSAEFPAAR